MKQKLIERLSNLLSIKSLVTLVVTFVFCYLSVANKIDAQSFMTVFTVIIAFYFGTQAKKE